MKKLAIFNSRRMRRFAMRKDDTGGAGQQNPMGGGAGATQGQPANNTGSNFGLQTQGQQQPNNNNGQQFDPTSFWNPPASGQSNPPQTTGGSAGQGDSGAGTQQGQNGQQQNQQPNPGQALGDTLRQQMTALTFAPVFTDSIANELGNGNFDNANKALSQIGAQAVNKSVEMSVMIMQQLSQHMEQRFQQMLQQHTQSQFNSRDNSAALEKDFPQLVANPGLKPQIEAVFNQALQNTGGNRDSAIAQTKTMLQFMGQNLQQQFGGFGGLNDAPFDPMGGGAKSLVDELLSRN